MSSLRNAVQRRNHRERAQPTERTKWGLLEKRKDYKLRAADHKSKQRKISALKQKASERNEDEFYFGMVNASTSGGIRRSRRGEENSAGGGKALDVDVVRLMKTQDAGYLRTMLQRTRLERERVGRAVVLGEKGVEVQAPAAAKGKVVFGEDGEEMQTARPSGGHEVEDEGIFDMEMSFLDEEDGADGVEEESEGEELTPEERAAKRKKRHALIVKRRKFEALEEQESKLSAALDGLEHQRAKMAGTVGSVNKNGVKFKVRQRKR
ncbi:U3 small nucleolar RNA-associated 11 [Lecanosticta acicola]|uniref:U3 small nucleolar RNA-associated 11 n=1 Tax=Lecanosticta acicola TaxID=111012 RepID=A0AAI8YY01_9PEZI|nr:U3 small nucleolar RNA-associated 11 [Lecanosticta acicola]